MATYDSTGKPLLCELPPVFLFFHVAMAVPIYICRRTRPFLNIPPIVCVVFITLRTMWTNNL